MEAEFLIFLAVGTALIFDAFCWGLWKPGYFRLGIPLFNTYIPYSSGTSGQVTASQLETHFGGSIGPSLLFQELEVDEWAFREKMFAFRLLTYTPIMHGLLKIDRDRSVVHVKGVANYFPIVFAVAFLLGWSSSMLYQVAGLLLLILGLCYGTQVWRYRRVARFVSTCMMTAPITIDKLLTAKKLHELGVYSWPIWEKEVSEFPWHYDERETCYLLEGDVTVTPDGGEPVRFGMGDFVTFPAGMSCTWKIHKPVRKHYRFG